jgi:hypothetical protein
MGSRSRACGLGIVASLGVASPVGAESTVRAPLQCSRGPGGQFFTASVTAPSSQPEGSTYTVRIDSVPSGEITHTWLRYVHDMATDYLLPAGTVFVPGSAHFVPRTGTANVLPGARVWHENGLLRVVLPAHVDNGSGYTPPSVELQLRVTAARGARLSLKLAQVRVAANVLLLGDVHTDCNPDPRSYVLATTVVTPAASAAPTGTVSAAPAASSDASP